MELILVSLVVWVVEQLDNYKYLLGGYYGYTIISNGTCKQLLKKLIEEAGKQGAGDSNWQKVASLMGGSKSKILPI